MATDTDGNITEWNPAAEKIFGWSREEVLGHFIPMLPAEGKDAFAAFRKKLFTGANLNHFEVTKLRKDGKPVELHVYPSRLINFDGKISGSILAMTDITDIKHRDLELRRTLSEKDMLLKEVHHRVKNNLQAISSILDIQKLHLKNRQLTEIFRESQNRIKSMALIHEELYNSREHALVNTRQYISHLLDHLFHSYDVDREKIELDLKIEELLLNIDTAIPCGLIINELVSNSLKYAFDGHGKGTVHVGFTTVGDVYRLRITDNGMGLPEDMDAKTINSLGMILVRSLADQLHSSMKVSRKGGTSFEFHFKIYEECQKSQL
jgi:PAS domain S-box-containing protein